MVSSKDVQWRDRGLAKWILGSLMKAGQSGEALRVAEVLIIVGWGLNAPPSTGEDVGMLMSESLHLD